MDIFFLQSFWGLFFLTFLPGFVILRLSHYRSSLIQELIGSLGISLLFNYIFIFIGTLFHLSLQIPLWIASFTFALLFLIIIFYETSQEKKQSLWVLLSSITMLLFLWFLNQFIAKSGSIPWAGDDIFGWNNWALAWYQGKGVYVQQNFYPQMLPTMWATSYLFSGTSEIFFFSRSLMPYFFFGIFIMGLGIFWTEKRITHFFGLISLGWLFLLWRDFPRMTMGTADIPAAFFGFTSFGFFLEYTKTKNWQSMGISLLLAVASSLTKQYGVLYLAGLGLLLLVQIKKYPSLLKEKSLWVISIVSFGLFASWYLYGFFAQGYHLSLSKLFTIGSFQAYSDNPFISQNPSSVGKNIFQSMLFLIHQFKSFLIFFAILIGWIVGIFSSPYGWVTLFITIPSFLFWSELIAYDIRNFSIGLVFFLYQGGIGLGLLLEKILSFSFSMKQKKEELISFFEKQLAKMEKASSFLLTPTGLLIGILVIGCSFVFSQPYLIQEQKKRMRLYVGNHREVNTMLCTYLEKNPSTIIYTDYPFISFIPDIHFIQGYFTNIREIQQALNSHEKLVFLIISSKGFPPSQFSPEVETFFRTNSYLAKVMEVETGMLVEKK
ncbi:MAG: hypothetical protein ACK4HQ_02900 [Brevinematales bacterium]